MNTEDTLSGFQDFFLQPIIKDRSNYPYNDKEWNFQKFTKVYFSDRLNPPPPPSQKNNLKNTSGVQGGKMKNASKIH